MPLADYATIICTGAAPVSAHADQRSPQAIVPETRVCIRSFVCNEIADAATRNDAAKRRRRYPPWRSASIRIGRDNTGRRSSDNNELLAADTVGNLSQPTSYVPPRLKINYDSIATTKRALSYPDDWILVAFRAMPGPRALQHPDNYALSCVSIRFFYQHQSKWEYL